MIRFAHLFCITLLLSFQPVLAGMFDDALNKVQHAAEQAVEDTVKETIDSATGQGSQSTPASPAATTASASAPDGYVTIDQIPNGRMPATQASVNLMKVRFEPDSLTDEILLRLTQNQILAQQKYDQLGPGAAQYFQNCIGVHGSQTPGSPEATPLRLAAVFTPAQIEGRDPEFAAQELKDEMRLAMLKLADHMQPKFGNTLTVFQKYDFETGELVVQVRHLEAHPEHWKRYLPETEQHRALFKVLDRNFGGTQGEFRPMRAMLPGIPFSRKEAVTILAFDRSPLEGRIAMPPAEAETFLKDNPQKGVLEFSIEKTVGNAALANLEKVVLLGNKTGGDNKPENLQPVLTVPASAFPLQQPEVAEAKPTQAVATPEPTATPTPEPAVDAMRNADSGQPYGPNVLDLRLGMTLEQADQVIRAYKTPVNVVDGQPVRPYLQGRVYVLEPGDEAISLFTLDSANGERIAGVVRRVYFDPDAAPTQTAIVSSIESKYGTPSYVYDSKGMFDRIWAMSPGGELYPPDDWPRAAKRAIHTSGSSEVWMQNGQRYIWRLPWEENVYGSLGSLESGQPRDFEDVDQCGPTLRARYSENGGMLTGPELEIALFDPAWIGAKLEAADSADKVQGAEGLAL